MSTRKYAYGIEKLKKKIKKKRKKVEKIIESQKGSLDKFVISSKNNVIENICDNLTNKQKIHQQDLQENVISSFASKKREKHILSKKILFK